MLTSASAHGGVREHVHVEIGMQIGPTSARKTDPPGKRFDHGEWRGIQAYFCLKLSRWLRAGRPTAVRSAFETSSVLHRLTEAKAFTIQLKDFAMVRRAHRMTGGLHGVHWSLHNPTSMRTSLPLTHRIAAAVFQPLLSKRLECCFPEKILACHFTAVAEVRATL